MAQEFSYKAKDRTGKLFTGKIAADNESGAALFLRGQGYYILDIKAANGSGIGSFENYLKDLRRVSVKEMAYMMRQFSNMISAGIPIVRCLSILIDTMKNPKLKEAMQDVYKRVKEGEPISKSLAVHPKVFPSIMINMIEAGEVGGVLDDVLNRLAVHLEKEDKLNGKIRSAMTYPLVVMVIAVIAIFVVLIFVMPNFVKLFKDMNISLPLPTKILLGVSQFANDHVLLVLGGVIAIGIGIKAALANKKIRFVLDKYILTVPVVGVLLQKAAVARFTRTLGTLLKSGVSLLVALDVVKRTMGNLMMIDKLNSVQINVKEGMSLSKTLSSAGIFNSMVVQMVSVGEESGSLDSMLEKVADFYENDVDNMVNNLSSLLEPFILVFLAVVVGFIASAVILPLFDIITGAGQTL
jgi:type IV pilus assembly protein PilC